MPCPLCPSSRLCGFTQCCLYIISVYPLPYVSIIGRDWCCQMYDFDWSPLPSLSGPGYNWGSRSLPRSSMSTHHRNNPLPQYWSPPSHQWGAQPSLLIITGQQTSGFCRGVRGAAATLMTINWLVFARQEGVLCRVLAGFFIFNAPPPSPPPRQVSWAGSHHQLLVLRLYVPLKSVSRGHYLSFMSDPW